MITRRILTPLAMIILLASGPALAQTAKEFVIVRPNSPNEEETVRPYLDNFIKEVGTAMGWAPGSMKGVYISDRAKGLEKLQSPNVSYAFLSLGLYLELRESQSLVPLVKVQMGDEISEKLYVYAQATGPKTLQELQGKTVAGPHVSDGPFFYKVVLKGLLAANSLKLQPSSRVLKELRRLTKGEIDAVVINETEKKSLPQLNMAGKIVEIYASDPLPSSPVVALGKRADGKEQEALTKVLSGLCASGKGKELCEGLLIKAFVPVGEGEYKKGVIELYEKK